MTSTLLRGGRVATPAHPDATAMLTEGGVVRWVGAAADAPDADRTVDTAGTWVAPAFVDAHVHATQTGLALTGLDLAGTPSLAAALDRLAKVARDARGRPVIGTGWDDTTWPERRPPTPAELDRASYGGVVYLARVDHHSAVASSALLAAAPAARTLAGWSASGHVTLSAHHEVRRTAYESITAAQRQMAQRACREHAAALGIACLQEMAGPQITGGVRDLDALLTLARTEDGPEVIGYWGELHGLSTVEQFGLAGAGGDLFCDGSLGSHTAALREPYADAPDRAGHHWHDAEAVAAHLVACTRAGVQGGFHAIGDAAIATILDGCERTAREVGLAALVAARHRIEHAELLPPGGVAGFARYGLVASVQPAFDAAWGGEHGMYAQRLGADRALGMNPFAAFLAAGVPLAFGSDSPVTPLDPWGAVRGALWHRTERARIPAGAAFAAATVGGWRAAGRTGEGALTPGSPATYAVWADPPHRGEPHRLPYLDQDAPTPDCLRTVLRGTTIYER
jgi:predicted amidohydrolase YtcJ